MANQQRPPEREREHTNGYSHDMDIRKTASKMVEGHPEVQGYLVLAGGVALLLFSFGFFPYLNGLLEPRVFL